MGIRDETYRRRAPDTGNDFPNHAAGGTGPAGADALLARGGLAWRPLD
jgi:hypothetical protein